LFVAGLAKRILDTADADLEISTRKIKAICKDELDIAQATGKAGPLLYSIACYMKRCIKGDVRVNEQYNSLIRQINERCRNISLALLSARTNMKKAMKVGTRGASLKWSTVKPRAEALLRQLMQQVDEAHEVMADVNRWAVPDPMPVDGDAVLQRFRVCDPVQNKDLILWATPHSIRLHNFQKLPSSVVGYVFVLVDGDFDGDTVELADPGGVCYFIAETNYSTSRFVKCDLYNKDSPAGPVVIAKVALPLETPSSIDLFCSYYADVFQQPGFDDAVLDLMQINVTAHDMKWFYDEADGVHAVISMRGKLCLSMNRQQARKVPGPVEPPPPKKKRKTGGHPDPTTAAAAASTATTAASSSGSGSAPGAGGLDHDPTDDLMLDLYLDDVTGLPYSKVDAHRATIVCTHLTGPCVDLIAGGRLGMGVEFACYVRPSARRRSLWDVRGRWGWFVFVSFCFEG
jgi:hypothetical protein